MSLGSIQMDEENTSVRISLRCNQLKLVLSSSESHCQIKANQSPIVGHFAAVVIFCDSFGNNRARVKGTDPSVPTSNTS